MKRSSDWAGSGGAGKPGAASSGEAHRDKRAADEAAREKLEKAATVSSIKSKLSKPKVLSTDLSVIVAQIIPPSSRRDHAVIMSESRLNHAVIVP